MNALILNSARVTPRKRHLNDLEWISFQFNYLCLRCFSLFTLFGQMNPSIASPSWRMNSINLSFFSSGTYIELFGFYWQYHRKINETVGTWSVQGFWRDRTDESLVNYVGEEIDLIHTHDAHASNWRKGRQPYLWIEYTGESV